ncbi:MAG: UDP-3-O-(3-hydroxymyristoyl)glucosamine N-acyltransferase [Terriglobales bacterium]|jgi:UDP-3-O-[3-hydroxymyristoyl] glucosamine N-acyltransferase
MSHSLHEIADLIHARLVGDGEREVAGIAAVGSATPQDLIFVADERHLPEALASAAGAIIAGEFAAAISTSKTLLVVAYPKLAFARTAALLLPQQHSQASVHPTAVLHPTVELAAEVSVQAHAVLEAGVTIGANTRIGPGCALGSGIRIGSDCVIEANVSVYPGTRIGDRVIVHAGVVLGGDGFGFVRDPETGRYEKFPQAGTVEIHDDVEIGCNTTIDRGALGATVIGRGVKIDNLVQIAHNCEIGENVVIAAQTGISGSCVIEADVIMGGQVGIGDHCRIERGVILGGGCGVLSNKVVRGEGVVFWGRPARPVKEYLKSLAALSRLAGKR